MAVGLGWAPDDGNGAVVEPSGSFGEALKCSLADGRGGMYFIQGFGRNGAARPRLALCFERRCGGDDSGLGAAVDSELAEERVSFDHLEYSDVIAHDLVVDVFERLATT